MAFLFIQRLQCFLLFLYVSTVLVQSFSIVRRAPEIPLGSDTSFCPQNIKIKDDAIYQLNANRATFGKAYKYDPVANPRMIIEVDIADIMTVNTPIGVRTTSTQLPLAPGAPLYNADHVFEAQIITQFFRALTGVPDIARICTAISTTDMGKELRLIMNHPDNMIWLDNRINNRKGQIFKGNMVANPDLYSATINYLQQPIVYISFATTRKKLIDYFCKVADNLVPPATIDIGMMFGEASSGQYMTVTDIPLIPLLSGCQQTRDNPPNTIKAAQVEIAKAKLPRQQAAKIVIPVIYLPGRSPALSDVPSLASIALAIISTFTTKGLTATESYIKSLPPGTIDAINAHKLEIAEYLISIHTTELKEAGLVAGIGAVIAGVAILIFAPEVVAAVISAILVAAGAIAALATALAPAPVPVPVP